MPAAHLASAYQPDHAIGHYLRNRCERRTGRHPRRGHPACAAFPAAPVLQFLDDAVLGALRRPRLDGVAVIGAQQPDGSKMSLPARRRLYASLRSNASRIGSPETERGSIRRVVRDQPFSFHRAHLFLDRRTGSWQVPRISSEGGDPVQFTRNGRFSPYEAPAGNCLYYQKGDVQVSELWRVPVGGDDRSRSSLRWRPPIRSSK